MIEINDSDGRLIVVLPIRLRHAGRLACVFVDGKKVAEFKAVDEAARYARSIAQGEYAELTGPPATIADE